MNDHLPISTFRGHFAINSLGLLEFQLTFILTTGHFELRPQWIKVIEELFHSNPSRITKDLPSRKGPRFHFETPEQHLLVKLGDVLMSEEMDDFAYVGFQSFQVLNPLFLNRYTIYIILYNHLSFLNNLLICEHL